MIKAVFLDYTGTIIQEKGEDLEKNCFPHMEKQPHRNSRRNHKTLVEPVKNNGRKKLRRYLYDRR